jgi:predicted regulator of Ras-like GTPase activity (Roadblock/LC7/MglB family)
MGMQGNLHDMAIADLIQHTCTDRKTASLTIDQNGAQAVLYFKDGQIAHATAADLAGEEAVFSILRYEDGAFNLELGVEPPLSTVTHSWSSLLIEGARRIDEGQIDFGEAELNFEQQVEGSHMGQKLDDLIKEMGGEVSSFILGTVIGTDGMSAAFHAAEKRDPDLVSAQMALLYKMVATTVTKLHIGTLQDYLATTTNTHILIRDIPKSDYFLCLIADRHGSLGNMRMISKLYSDKISKMLAG